MNANERHDQRPSDGMANESDVSGGLPHALEASIAPSESTLRAAENWLARLRQEEAEADRFPSASTDTTHDVSPNDETNAADSASSPPDIDEFAHSGQVRTRRGDSRRGDILRIGGVAALLIAGGLFAWSRSHWRNDVDDLRRMVQVLSESRQLLMNDLAMLQRALAYLQPTTAERRANVYANFVDPDDVNAANSPPHDVKITVKNVRFPIVLRWKSGDEESIKHLPSGDSELTLPTHGMTTIFCEPLHGRHWYQIAGIGLPTDEPDGFAYQGSTLGKITASLASHDRVLVHLGEPAPAWNATLVPVQGDWMLVTLDRPWGDFEVDRWINNRPPDSEELPNTATFWARDGSEGLAAELADYFVANRDKPTGRWGRFRGRKHTNVVVPAKMDEVLEPFRSISRDELAKQLVTAFELIRKKRPPVGRSIEEEITEGRKSLERLRAAQQ